MKEIGLSAGTIEYEDMGGSGPAILFLHGLIMDGTLWRHVVAGLRPEYRCVLTTLPLGGIAARCGPTPTSRCLRWRICWPSSWNAWTSAR